MIRFILIRLVQTIIALFGISILIFGLVRLSGDPILMMITPLSTPDQIAALKAKYGVDKPAAVQYLVFMDNLFHGDLGQSIAYNRPVAGMIGRAVPNTLRLALLAFAIGMLLAVLLGVLAATRRDTWLDQGVKFLAVLGQALPGFWLAIMGIFVLSVHWELLPPSGMGNWTNYVLPVGTIAFFLLPGMMRLVRSSMLDVLDSEYVKLARIKGLPERTIIWKHALRNAMIAPLTTAGMILATLITGEVIIETVFAWPGVGRLLVDAMQGRDFPVVQGVVLMIAFIVLLVNLLVDILYAYVDPQIRYQST